MKDLRIWGVKDGRNEGWKDGWIEGWLEGRAGSAAPRGQAGLAFSGDLIRGGPGRSWDALGTVLGGSWDALGRSWDALGASSGRFGQPLRPLRRYSEHLIRFRDPPLPYLAPFW